MHRHTQHNGVKVIAEEGHEGGISRLQVLSQTRTLLACKRELNRSAFVQRLTEVKELLGCSTHDAVRTVRGLYITAGEGLLVIHNECQESREITVLDRWHERFVLAECAGEEYGELRARDRRSVVRAVTRDGFVLRGFAERGVVVRYGRTPYIGNNRAFGLMDVAAESVDPIMQRPQIIDNGSFMLGYAGVYSSFLLHVYDAAKKYKLDPRDILVELGRRGMVGGQEDMIIDVAYQLSQKK